MRILTWAAIVVINGRSPAELEPRRADMTAGMELCVMVEGQEGVSWPQWLAIARACEEHGVGTLLRSDHYMPLDGGEGDALDAWGTICALAAVTTKLELGTLVSPATFRHPAVLAKLAATADAISGGRVTLGLGAGWHDSEHATFGFPYPPLGERMDNLAAQLATVREQWGDGHPARPKPQQPRLIMGGAARPRGAALAARFADEYNVVYASHEEIREMRAGIAAACDQAGRPMMPFSLMTGFVIGREAAEVETRRAALAARGSAVRDSWIVGTLDEARDQLSDLAALGVDRVMMQMLLHDDVAQVELIGEL
jgi:alkanesulfonate monooxygenase SsuD/methylene tetrahydromethanopterin reductase-like flavin-dependent oxidoreductase (luciferase family)